MKMYLHILRSVFFEKKMRRFFYAVIAGLSFSIAVILMAMALMQGFEKTLIGAVTQEEGYFKIYRSRNFFTAKELEKHPAFSFLQQQYTINYEVESEAFLVFGEKARGVKVKTVAPQKELAKDEVLVGASLAQDFSLKKDNRVELMFAQGNDAIESLPAQHFFRVAAVERQNIYEQDARVIYLHPETLQKILSTQGRFNVASLTPRQNSRHQLSDFKKKGKTLRRMLTPGFRVRSTLEQYSYLLNAVESEKGVMILIFQVIVVIAIFNLLAFVYYARERKKQMFFLLQALGLAGKTLLGLWIFIFVVIWLFSCLGAALFYGLLSWGFSGLGFLLMPPQIYFLQEIHLHLSSGDGLTIFLLALFWIMVVAIPLMVKFKNKTIIDGLRGE